MNQPNREWAFRPDGTFSAVDHASRVGVFAFPTSDNANLAKRRPDLAANLMLDAFWSECPDNLREEHYRMSCDDITSSEELNR